MPLEKQVRTRETRRIWRQECLDRLELAQPTDIKHIFGVLASTLAQIRRERELDEIRCERFHTDNRSQKSVEIWVRRINQLIAVIRNKFSKG